MTVATADVDAARAAGASSSDLALISKLKAYAAQFTAYRQDLQRRGPAIARTNDYDLMVEYGRLVDRADYIQEKVTAALAAIDSAFRTARSALGLDGLRALSALGVVWLIPVAVIAAAVALIGYWITDYLKFVKRDDARQQIVAQLTAAGMSPIEANRQAAETTKEAGGLFADVGKAAGLVAALVGAYFFYQWYRGR